MKRVFLTLGVMGLIGLLTASLAAVALYMWASRDLPSFTKVSDYQPPQVTTIYARDGSIMAYYYNEKRFMITLAEMTPYLPKAFLAKEDADFYTHKGVNPKAIARAFLNNLTSDRQQGGSTITQQVVKRLVTGAEKSYERKLREAILAYKLEGYLTKDEILNIYLNQIFFGNGAYGVEAAAQTYFAKHASELNLAECAVLAALPQAPSDINPYANPEVTKEKQVFVLSRLRSLDWITEEEHKEALDYELAYKRMPDPDPLGAWYAEEVRRRLIDYFSPENIKRLNLPLDRYGKDAVYNSGLNVYTCMDPVHQRAAETALRKGLLETSKRHGWVGPLGHIAPADYTAYLSKNTFTPGLLANAGWAKALVTAVNKNGAEVRLGAYKGVIAANGMEWSKRFNKKSVKGQALAQREEIKGVEPGDIIWVSAVGAKGFANPVGMPSKEADAGGKNSIPAYDAASVTPDQTIKLCLEQMPPLEGAITSLEVPSGDAVAMVGGYAYSASGDYINHFNRATQAIRQPGSSFKPIVYSAALDNGFTAASMLQDAPFVIEAGNGVKGWRPSNFDGTFKGPMILRTALALSRNACTVRVAEAIGMDTVVQRAHDLGIVGNMPTDLAISLGAYDVPPLAMAQAYTAFANNGTLAVPRFVTSITDTLGNTIVNFSPDSVPEAISPQNAYVMATLLKDVVNAGTATRAKVLGRPVAGKTGTTNEERDAWFIGFSPYLVTSIYVGYDARLPMGSQETGGRIGVPIFINYREAVDDMYEPTDFTAPEGISMAAVDAETGDLAGPHSAKVLTLPFIAGTAPTIVSGQPLGKGQDDVRSGEELIRQQLEELGY